jgi:outer membrane protein OmpA-like peptidoglycan-associated protein
MRPSRASRVLGPLARACSLAGFAACLVAAVSACAPKAAPAPPPEPVGVPAPPARAVTGPQTPPLSNPDLVKVFASRGLDAREEGAGVVLYLPTVYLFEFGKSDVDAAARTQLREIASLLVEPMLAGRRVTVEGHADGVGSRRINQSLSEARARAVIAVLEAGGVAKARLRTRAYGKDRPLEPNTLADGTDNPDGRARNRRVALVIENP